MENQDWDSFCIGKRNGFCFIRGSLVAKQSINNDTRLFTIPNSNFRPKQGAFYLIGIGIHQIASIFITWDGEAYLRIQNIDSAKNIGPTTALYFDIQYLGRNNY